MAEPTIEMDTRAYDTTISSRSDFNIPIIDGGVVQSGTLRWSSSGVSGNVTLPTSGNKWAEELWWDSTTDTKIMSSSQTPDSASQPQAMFVIDTDAVAFDTAPKITVYDSSSHTEVEEVCVGTTNHPSPFIKGRISTSYAAPSQYWGEADSDTLHAKEVAGAVTPDGNNGLCGSTNYLQASSTDLNSNPQYLWLALSIPSDATTGVDAIDCVLTIEYTFT